MSYIYTTVVPQTPNTVSSVTASSIGSGYTTLGYNGTSASFVGSSQNFVSNNGKTLMSVPRDEQTVVLEREATLDVKGNVKINGVDLEERLNTIEKVLQIPTRDVTMEAKHPRLKALYEAYMHELEKYKTWDRLNGDENVT